MKTFIEQKEDVRKQIAYFEGRNERLFVEIDRKEEEIDRNNAEITRLKKLLAEIGMEY